MIHVAQYIGKLDSQFSIKMVQVESATLGMQLACTISKFVATLVRSRTCVTPEGDASAEKNVFLDFQVK